MATTRPPLFVDVRLRKPKAAQVKPNNESPLEPLDNTVGIVVPDTAPAPHARSVADQADPGGEGLVG